MDVKLTPAKLEGKLSAIPSKSAAHRLLICAALSDKPTKLIIGGSSQDIDATVNCLKALGSKITEAQNGLTVNPIDPPVSPSLDCGESGSTFRFMLPVTAAVANSAAFFWARQASRPPHRRPKIRHGAKRSKILKRKASF